MDSVNADLENLPEAFGKDYAIRNEIL